MTNLNAKYMQLYTSIGNKIDEYEQSHGGLVGINGPDNRNAFILQVIDSIRRVNFQRYIRATDISPSRHATDNNFDPYKSAVLHFRNGNFDEACWLIFLATHFGKSGETGWRLLKDFYGAFQEEPFWTWVKVSSDLGLITQWLTQNYGSFVNDGIKRKFGKRTKTYEKRSLVRRKRSKRKCF